MRPIVQRLSAAGYSPWIPINRLQRSFAVGLGVTLSSGAVLTYSVQHTMDQLHGNGVAAPVGRVRNDFSVARTTTTGTITMTDHGLSVGDWWMGQSIGAPFDSDYSVASVVDVNNFTITVANSGITASAEPKIGICRSARVASHATLAAQTASGTGNYAFPPWAVRFIITAYTSGFADFIVMQGN